MEDVFYNLKGQPFRLSPDHRFCYDHKCYAKARAYMAYAFMRAEGFVMITGRPGTGKTTLIGELIESLADENVVTANLVCTQLHADDLLKVTAYDFGIDPNIVEKGELLQQLGMLFRRWNREGRRVLLIVDEAQDLSESAMEELRLLTNIQENGKPLLQIFLLGQPELRDLLLSPSMEQVHQRIVAASHLEALEREETEAYIIHRLKKVGWQGDPALSKAIFPLVHKFSEGVPRRINLICSRLFLHGTVEQRHQIGVNELRAVIEELQSENLAAGTQFHDDEFEVEDEYEETAPSSPADKPVEHCAESGESPEATRPASSEPTASPRKEYLHAVGEETVLHFETTTEPPRTDIGKKKDDVVALRPTAPGVSEDSYPTQKNHVPSRREAPERAPSRRQTPSDDSRQRATPPRNTQRAVDNTKPPSTPKTNKQAGNNSPDRKQATPKLSPKKTNRLPALLSTIIFLALALLAGWLAFERGLTSREAWQRQLDDWWRLIATVDTSNKTARETTNHQSIATLPPLDTKPEPLMPAIPGIPTPEPLFATPPVEESTAPLPEQPSDPEWKEEREPATVPESEQPVSVLLDAESLPNDTSLQAPSISAVNPPRLHVMFNFDSDSLSADAKEALDDVAGTFIASGASRIFVTGYADERGDRFYNLALSRRRANAVAGYLIDKGVDSEFLTVRGLGIYTETGEGHTDPLELNGRIVQLEISNSRTGDEDLDIKYPLAESFR